MRTHTRCRTHRAHRKSPHQCESHGVPTCLVTGIGALYRTSRFLKAASSCWVSGFELVIRSLHCRDTTSVGKIHCTDSASIRPPRTTMVDGLRMLLVQHFYDDHKAYHDPLIEMCGASETDVLGNIKYLWKCCRGFKIYYPEKKVWLLVIDSPKYCQFFFFVELFGNR